MASAATFTKTGTKASKQATLPKEVFAVDVSDHSLVVQAYDAQQANSRHNWAKAKTRAEVRGGGRKPWRQKGTGKARAGSIRSPIWRGGGITFGPEGRENYSKKLNRNTARKALAQALSLKAADKSVSVIEDIALKEGKTKELKKLIDKLGLDKTLIIVVKDIDTPLKRASSNLPNVRVLSANYLNTKAAVDADHLLFTKPALDELKQRLGGK